MTNNCPSCGKELKEGAKFCQYCGNKIQAQTVPPSPPPQQYQQPPTPQPAPAPMQPKKSKTGLIIGIVAVVVVVVVLLVVMLMFFSGGLNLGGALDPIYNAVTLAELAIEKGAETLIIPISARKQLIELSDEMAMKINIIFYSDAKEALVKALVE